MPRPLRSQVIAEDEVFPYLVRDEMVRQETLLLGHLDFEGQSVSRREWLRRRLETLAGLYLIDVCGYGLTGNEQYTILRNRPDLVAQLSDEEVVRAWWEIAPEVRDKGVPAPMPVKYLDAKLIDAEWLVERRRRLSSISWFMWSLKHPFALAVNACDGTTGHVWASRFRATRLESLDELLAAMALVDMKRVRAGETNSVLASKYVSANDRARARNYRDESKVQDWNRNETVTESRSARRSTMERLDSWLSPVKLNISASSVGDGSQHREPNEPVTFRRPLPTRAQLESERSTARFIPRRRRASNIGLLPIRAPQYLEFVRSLVEYLRSGEKARVPAAVQLVLRTLGVGPPSVWLSLFASLAAQTDRLRCGVPLF